MENVSSSIEKWTMKKKIMVVLVGSALFAAAFLYIAGDGQSPSISPERGASENLEIMAFVHAKEFVKLALKSPSSADFSLLDFGSAHLGNNRFQVASYVDAENEFGAKVRSNWAATLRYLGGDEAGIENWELEKLVIDGERIFPEE